MNRAVWIMLTMALVLAVVTILAYLPIMAG